jgi:hypothetical protein
MDNQEKLATQGTEDTGRRQTIQKYNTENQIYEQYGPHQSRVRAQASAMGKQFLPSIRHRHVTHIVNICYQGMSPTTNNWR